MMASVARITQDMADAKRVVTSATTSINSAIDITTKALGALGIGLSVNYFVGLVKGAIDAQDHLENLSKATSIAVEQLAGLKFAAAQSGGDLDSIANSVNKLAQNMGKSGDSFKALGITAKDPLKAFEQLSDVFVLIQDPQLKAAVAAQALGKGWQGAAPLLAEGSAKIAEMVAAGTQLSGVTNESAEQAKKFSDSMKELEGAIDGAKNKIVGQMLPGMTDIVKAITLAYEESGKLKAAWVALGGLGAFLFTDEFASNAKKLATLNQELEDLTMKRGATKGGWFSDLIYGGSPAELDTQIAATRVQIAALMKAMEPPPGAPPPDAAAAAAAAARAKAFLDGNKDAIAAAKELQRLTDLDQKNMLAGIQANLDANDQFYKDTADLADANAKHNEQLQAEDLKGWVAMAQAKVDADFAEAQQIANDQIAAVKKIEDAQKAMDKEINRGLTDALMRGFESGKSFAYNFTTALTDMFKTLVLKPIIEFVLSPVSGAITSTLAGMGLSGAANAAGAANGGLNLLNLLGFTSSGSGATIGSLVAANAAGATGGDAIGTLIAANASSWGVEASGVAAGSAGLGALAAAAPYVAAALFIANELGLFSGGGQPKPEDMFAMKNTQGALWFGDNNISNYPVGGQSYAAISDFIGRMYTTYGAAQVNSLDLSKLSISEAPGTGWDKVWADFQTTVLNATKDLTPLAGQVAMTGNAAADAAAALAAANAKLQQETDLATELATIQRDRADAALQVMNDARTAVWTAYDTEAAKLQQIADAMAAFSTSLRATAAAMGTGPGGAQTFGSAQAQFRDLARRAGLGDQTALSQLGAAGQSYYQLAGSSVATQADLMRVYEEVQAGLLAGADTADRQASIATQQIDYLKQQVEQLVGIRAGVQSLADAMTAFTAAQSAFKVAALAAGPNLSPAAAGALVDLQAQDFRTRVSSIDAAYQQILGRPADIAGLTFYNNSGESIAQIQADLQYAHLHGSYAAGTSYVPDTGPYMLHQGERVVSSSANDDLIATLESIRQENVAMRAELTAMRRDIKRTADITDGVVRGQLSFATTAA